MKVKKILVILIVLMMLSFTIKINIVQAALQSNGNAPATKNRNTWITQVRTMETLGGTLGLIETQNADLTSSSGSNSLDIHMQKNTEYGAMALLSASSYGNPSKIENAGTTTGNETGVVIPYNKEWTAAQYTDIVGKTSYAERYIDYYTGYGIKKGDALIETQGWHATTYFHGGTDKEVYVKYADRAGANGYYSVLGLVRNIGDGIFGYNNTGGPYVWASNDHKWGRNGDHTAKIENAYTSRAVIINGEGI